MNSFTQTYPIDTTKPDFVEVYTKEEKKVLQRAVRNPVATVRSLVKEDLFLFMQYFWDTYTEDTFIPNWHIEKICRELETVARQVGQRKPKLYDLLINIPPGTTKTATVSIFWPVWCWVNWPWMRFITSSHSSNLSLESAEYSRDVIRSEKFRQIFPDLQIKQDKDTKSNFRVVFQRNGLWLQGGSRVSTSVGAKITGFHAHIIIPDDLVDPHSAVSETKLAEAIRHLDQTLSTRKVSKEVTATVMIAQRLSPSDPPGHWLSKEKKNIKHISLPGEISNYKEFLKPVEWEQYYKDQVLDINRMGWHVLDEMREDLGQYGFHGQVGQNPILAGAGMFDVDMISITDNMPTFHHVVSTVRYWDKAATDGEGAYTAGVKIARLDNGTYIVIDVKRGQWRSDKREQIIRLTAEADGPTCRIGIEQEGGSGGKESAEATVRNLAGFSVLKDRPTGRKEVRADTYSVQVNDGNVKLLRGDWNTAYLNEMRDFPMGKYLDQIDASSGAFTMLTKKKKVEVWRKGKR